MGVKDVKELRLPFSSYNNWETQNRVLEGWWLGLACEIAICKRKTQMRLAEPWN